MNSLIRSFLAVASVPLTLASMFAAESAMPSSAASAPMGEMAKTPGLEVCKTAPAFTLKDAAGKEVSLGALLAKGKVALVFYRSADWCPFCIAQLKDLQANLAAFEQAGVTLVGISYDSPDVLARAAKKHGVTFPLLADEGSKAIDAFGVRNHEAKGKGDGIPHPAVFVLDGKGVIRAKLLHENFKDYKNRPSSAEILAAAKGIM
jgi:peroxiredoxin